MYSYRSHSATWVAVFLTATSLGCLRLSAQVSGIDQQTVPPAAPSQEQPEVLSRGPVHEAFAEPVTMQTQDGLIASQQPPSNIEEVPPAERPQGSQFVWIPGYWSWDADRSGYIWVSACWRAAPPKMSWVPGYWSQVSGGWEWIAGYWAPAGVKNIEYLPAPPAIEDLEPVTVQPSPDTIWVPPCMYWSNGHYVRRAGYWLAAQPNWVWVPSHYVMTPRGYIFAEGHWDYSLDRRGVLFAPVYFPASVYLRAGFTFSPGIVVDLGLLQVNLFAYPRYCHYYFGDYYDGAYLSIGIYPWFESRRYHTWYDPIYEHERWHHRSDSRWEERGRDEYRQRFDDKNLRPAHTFREQESRLARLPESRRHASQVVQSLDVAVSSRKTSIKFERIDTDARQKISKQAATVHTYSDNRNHWEAPAAGSRTAHPSKGQQPKVIPSVEPNRTIQPVEEHKKTVIPSTDHGQTIHQPATENKTVVRPSEEVRRTIQPVEESKTATPSVDRRQTTLPTEERKATVTLPTERRQTVEPPRRTESTVAAPDAQRERTFSPHREPQVSQPERVQVPTSPIVGNSGRQGLFRKGQPAQPADESKNYIDTDSRRR